jgi:hypothetical protein
MLIPTVWRPADCDVVVANTPNRGSISRNEGQDDQEFTHQPPKNVYPNEKYSFKQMREPAQTRCR